MSQSPPQKIVLAYSGGLDTSVILPWLKERYPGVKLVAFAAELGQGDELKGIEDKARKSGADEVVVMDLRREFAESYCFPMLRAHAIDEQDYLLGAEIEHPDAEPNWEACLTMVVPPEKAPNEAEVVSVEFEAGNPVAVNGTKLAGDQLIAELNRIGGRHGVGVTVLAENRLVGMKSR